MAIAPVSQEQLLGNLIPDVYINGITLSTSGSPIKEENPHIQHERERDRPKLKQSEQLVVTVDLSLKERLNTDLISSWFAEQDFTKYLKIKMIQSRNELITKYLTEEKSSIVYPHQEWKEKTQGMVETRILSVDKDVIGDGSNLTQHRSYIDQDGTSIHDITYRAVFYIPEEQPSHLTYFAVSYLDMDALIKDYDLSVDDNTLNLMNGKVCSDMIIHKGEIISSAWVYRTKDGLIWSGAVHNDNGKIMSGAMPSFESQPLQKIKVTNSKIQDFRDVKEIEKLKIDLSVFENTLSTQKNKIKLKNNDNTDVKRKKTYFTDIHVSRDSDGSARFTFGVDFKQYVKDNSIYGKLFENTSSRIRKGIFQSAKIRTMKVYRRRVRNVQTQNRLGSAWHGEVIWDRHETPVLVVASGEKNRGQFRKRRSNIGSIKEIQYTLNSPTDVEDMRFFTVMDRQIKDVTDGHYQYGVEIEVEDGSFNYLNSWVSRLSKEKRELGEYLERGSKLGMTKFLSAVDDPHIDHEMERAKSLRDSDGNYEPTSNRFTKKFFESEQERYRGNLKQAPWNKAPWEYLTAVQVMTAAFTTHKSWYKMYNSLLRMVNPQTGNPRGIAALISLYDNLISKIQRVLAQDSGTRTVRAIEGDRIPKTKIRGKTSKTPVKIFHDTKWFTSKSFDTNVQKNAGLRFLWAGELEGAKNRDGLKEIDGGYYQARVNIETKKYFKSLDVAPNLYAGSQVYTDGDSLSNTSFTFLTPSMIELPNTSMKTIAASATKDPYSGDHYSLIESSILAFNSGVSMGRRTLESSSEYRTTMASFFASLNAVVTPIDGWEAIPLTDHLKGHAQGSAYASGSLLPAQPPKPIDPIIQIHTKCDTELDGDASTNPNSLFAGLCQPFLKSGASLYGNNTNPFAVAANADSVTAGNTSKEDNSYSLTQVDTNTISFYDLNSSGNAITKMFQDPEMSAAVLASNGHPNGVVSVKTALLTIPNQVKSLFYASTSPSSVKKSWHDMGFDPLKDLRTLAEFRINHLLIGRIDRLTGYRKSMGKRHTKEPKWEPLTKNAWSRSAGEAILCRIKKYHSPQLGIKWLPAFDLPIYDEYFVLKPPVLQAESSTPDTSGTTSHPVDEGLVVDVSANESDPEYTETNHFDC